MSSPWPAVSYESWNDTCDTLHAHTQVLGKLAVALAPPEPELQHAALRLSARGWETTPYPLPTAPVRWWCSSTCAHTRRSSSTATVERPGSPLRPTGRSAQSPGTCSARWRGWAARSGSTRPPGGVLDTYRSTRTRHARYDIDRVDAYFEAATQAALVLAEFRAPYPGALHAGERLVGLVRPGHQPLFGKAGRSTVGRLHHAQRHGRTGSGRRLVAG